jgi:hypothetical protein
MVPARRMNRHDQVGAAHFAHGIALGLEDRGLAGCRAGGMSGWWIAGEQSLVSPLIAWRLPNRHSLTA